MKKIAVFLAEGFEEVEALTPVDILRRAGFTCDTVSIAGEFVTGSHGITVKADRTLAEDLETYDMLVCPGGLPGSVNLRNCAELIRLIRQFAQDPAKKVAAICAAPQVLAEAGVVSGRHMTSYPGEALEALFADAIYHTDRAVIVDGNMITSRGAGTAMEFAFTLVDELGGDSQPLRDGMMYAQYLKAVTLPEASSR